jgi:hypothetical protein
MTPVITAFACSPDRGQGQARDMRVRWANAVIPAQTGIHGRQSAEGPSP